MRYFEMPARWVADDTQNASVSSPTTGRKAKPNTLDEALGREAVSRPGSICFCCRMTSAGQEAESLFLQNSICSLDSWLLSVVQDLGKTPLWCEQLKHGP
jgi:hypothetical protein